MDVDIFTLCDYASSNDDGMLSINGTYDVLTLSEFPGVLPLTYIAGRIRLNEEDTARHTITLSLVQEQNGQIIFSIQGIFEPTEKRYTTNFRTASFAVKLENLEFKEPGLHLLQLFINNKLLKQIPAHVFSESN